MNQRPLDMPEESCEKKVFERPGMATLIGVLLFGAAAAAAMWVASATAGGEGPFDELAQSLALVAPALAAAALAGAALRTRFDVDENGISRFRMGGEERVEWERVSPFSETEPTHREGDRHCMLKSRSGDTLMAVSPHLLGKQGEALLHEIRQRIGPPALQPDGQTEVFRYGEFGGVPPLEFHLDAHALQAVFRGHAVEARLDEIQEIAVSAWPEVGVGVERAHIVRKGEALYVDSRLVGFWPLIEYLAAHCPHAKVSDKSRRSRLGRGALG